MHPLLLRCVAGACGKEASCRENPKAALTALTSTNINVGAQHATTTIEARPPVAAHFAPLEIRLSFEPRRSSRAEPPGRQSRVQWPLYYFGHEFVTQQAQASSSLLNFGEPEFELLSLLVCATV